MLTQLLFLASLQGAAAPVAVEPKAPEFELEAVTAAAIEYLLDAQEAYEPDPPVGSLPDDELAGWQAKERKRLAAARGDADADARREWPYEGVYRVAPDGRIPAGYRVGGTSIVCLALMRAPGFSGDEARRAAVQRSIDFVLEMLTEDESMEPGPKKRYDVRGWGHTYALEFFLAALEAEAVEGDERIAAVTGILPHLVDCLEANTVRQGGWNYAGRGTSPFMTGATALTLMRAEAFGLELPKGMLEDALDGLEESRTDIRSYAYSGKARGEVEMPGSSARSCVAELALAKGGRAEEADVRKAVLGFFEGYEDLLARKSQQGTHEGDYGIAPYYFFFGHTYVAEAIASLADDAEQHRAELLRLLNTTREECGAWNDRIFPRTSAYSTAMVLLALYPAS